MKEYALGMRTIQAANTNEPRHHKIFTIHHATVRVFFSAQYGVNNSHRHALDFCPSKWLLQTLFETHLIKKVRRCTNQVKSNAHVKIRM